MAASLAELHLADLHALAAELGVEEYRLLSQTDLIKRLELLMDGSDGYSDASDAVVDEAPVRTEAPDGETPDQAEAAGRNEVRGLLHLRDQGPKPFGFVHPDGFERTDEAVYVADALVEKYNLRPADEVAGGVEAEADGRRSLIDVTWVNEVDPTASQRRPRIEEAIRIPPQLRDFLAPRRDDLLARAVDLLAPPARGQRTLVVADTDAERSRLLGDITRALLVAWRTRLVVASVATEASTAEDWDRTIGDSPAEFFTTTGDVSRSFALVRFALERARRLAELRKDVVLVVDSLPDLEAGVGTVTAEEAELLESLASASRVLPGGGSLTVLAGAANDVDADADNVPTSVIAGAPEGAGGVGIDPQRTYLFGEQYLREPRDLARITNLRERLAELSADEARAWLGERIGASGSNHRLLLDL